MRESIFALLLLAGCASTPAVVSVSPQSLVQEQSLVVDGHVVRPVVGDIRDLCPGVVCDGVTEESAKINACFQQLSAAGGAEVQILQPGEDCIGLAGPTNVVGDGINIPSHMTIRMLPNCGTRMGHPHDFDTRVDAQGKKLGARRAVAIVPKVANELREDIELIDVCFMGGFEAQDACGTSDGQEQNHSFFMYAKNGSRIRNIKSWNGVFGESSGDGWYAGIGVTGVLNENPTVRNYCRGGITIAGNGTPAAWQDVPAGTGDITTNYPVFVPHPLSTKARSVDIEPSASVGDIQAWDLRFNYGTYYGFEAGRVKGLFMENVLVEGNIIGNAIRDWHLTNAQVKDASKGPEAAIACTATCQDFFFENVQVEVRPWAQADAAWKPHPALQINNGSSTMPMNMNFHGVTLTSYLTSAQASQVDAAKFVGVNGLYSLHLQTFGPWRDGMAVEGGRNVIIRQNTLTGTRYGLSLTGKNVPTTPGLDLLGVVTEKNTITGTSASFRVIGEQVGCPEVNNVSMIRNSYSGGNPTYGNGCAAHVSLVTE